MLKAYGVEVERERVAEAVPLEARGCSLKHLRDAAARFGLRTAVVRAAPASLDRLVLPAIVHIDPGGDTGHFLLLLRLNRDPSGGVASVSVLDDCDEDVVEIEYNEFLRQWSGLCLIRGGVSLGPVLPVACSLLASVLVIVAWLAKGSRLRLLLASWSQALWAASVGSRKAAN
ncbi:MAG: hypothetical protein HY000_06450 [Planctomycetes bacterium]|nr:hypothetical protein [Planctomycetota bacterium]